ncbi:hypothetical protein AVEN_196284-1 [Araneus ventricosus]|uniref:DDE-1 domain-containing protein n=1 Tax=Araneus ventricosus TaxID=182803 RepID=A0A4Y2JIQ0_ARAVE|nr:hypothetical protein AVEN_196284-1 [Araneus ventricosus]
MYNVVEIGVTTIQKPKKIIVRKGNKQIGSVASVERGSLVTMTLGVGANGDSVPTFFSRKNPLNITSFQMHLKEGEGQQINLDGWAGFSKLLETFYKTYKNHLRETYPSSSRQSISLISTYNIGHGLRKQSNSFDFSNYIFVKTVIQAIIMIKTHQNNL